MTSAEINIRRLVAHFYSLLFLFILNRMASIPRSFPPDTVDAPKQAPKIPQIPAEPKVETKDNSPKIEEVVEKTETANEDKMAESTPAPAPAPAADTTAPGAFPDPDPIVKEQGEPLPTERVAEPATEASSEIVSTSEAEVTPSPVLGESYVDVKEEVKEEIPAPAPVAERIAAESEEVTEQVEKVEEKQTPSEAPAVEAAPQAPKASSTPAKRPPPPLKTLQAWLPLYLRKTDAVLTRLSTILSTPRGIDVTLMLIGYSSLLTSSVLTQVTKTSIHLQLLRLLRLAEEKLPPGSTILIETDNLPAPRTLRLARSLQSASSMISDIRTALRLWGLLGMWQWGKSVFCNPSEDKVVQRISEIQVVVNTIYQVLENGAYLSGKGVMGWSEERQNKAWLWSSRMWATHVGLEFVRLGHELMQSKKKKKGGFKEPLMTDVEKTAEDALEEATLLAIAVKEKQAAWKRQVVVNGAYAPMTIHWSLEGGLLTPFVVGCLGTVVGVTNIRQLWKNAA